MKMFRVFLIPGAAAVELLLMSLGLVLTVTLPLLADRLAKWTAANMPDTSWYAGRG
jgi:hypothetical protein